MRRGHDARSAVDRRSKEIIVTTLDDTDMQSAPHGHCKAVGRFEVGERLLQRERGSDRIERIVEGGVSAVAGRLHDHAMVRLHDRARDRIVASQREAHPPRVMLPQTGAALDVGKEKRCGGYGLHGSASPLRGLLEIESTAVAQTFLASRAPPADLD